MISGMPSIARRADRMVYVSGQYETRILRIALGATATGEPKVLVDAIGDHSDLAVSGNGSRIAFVSNRTGSKEIWTARADGSGQTQVTFFDGPAVGSPRWSPDAIQIVFDGYASGSSDIYLIAADGGKPVRLTTDPGNEVRPSWSHDGKWVYFSWDRKGDRRGIWKISPSGGEPVKVAPDGNNAFESPDGEWLYVSNAPKLWRMRTDGTGSAEVTSALPATNDWNIGGHSVYILDYKNLDLLRAPFGQSNFKKAYDFNESNFPSGSGAAMAMPNDESYAIYRKVTRSVNTLTLIEGFR
jgi:Tol biopolymer transport system component